ncbi:MAG: hypothetical protein JWN78_1404 [Bacteroidota bacterium]|nr:hypothetical protein [Bacteroidota bacterium]
MKKDRHLTSFTKGVSWRVVGTIDTFVISYLVQFFHINFINSTKESNGSSFLHNASLIALIDFFTKIFLFYCHERIWIYFLKDRIHSKLISFAKAVSWRFVGSIDTMIWSGLILNDFKKGIMVGMLEFGSKIILYYFHERIWMHFTKENADRKVNVIFDTPK